MLEDFIYVVLYGIFTVGTILWLFSWRYLLLVLVSCTLRHIWVLKLRAGAYVFSSHLAESKYKADR